MSPASGISPVLVTGGAGFIGSHLCEALLEGRRPVVLLDNFDPFYDPALKRANLDAVRRRAVASGTSLHLLAGDVRRPGDLERALAAAGGGEPPTVIHLAAKAGVRPSIEDPAGYYEVNVTGTLHLLEACRRAGVRRLVFASSSSVYGNAARVPFSEEDPVDRPISPYAATKRAGELLCHTFHHLYGLSAVCLRFFTVYGPRQRPDLAIHKFARLMQAGDPLPFFGDGRSRRDYTYISDTLQGILGSLAWLERSVAPVFEMLNLGESRTVDLSTLVRLLSGALGVTPRLQRLPAQPGDVECTFADIAKARRLVGYDPRVPVEEGIDRFVRWFASRPSGEG